MANPHLDTAAEVQRATKDMFAAGTDNVAEETISAALGKMNPDVFLENRIFLTLAIIFLQTPPLLRFVVANAIATFIRSYRKIPNNMRRPLAIFITSIPQGLDRMLDRADLTPEELENRLKEAYENRGKAEEGSATSNATSNTKNKEKFEACVGVDPTRQSIHKGGVHVLDDNQMVNRGSEFHIFRRFGGIYPVCRICFPDEPLPETEAEKKEEAKPEEKPKEVPKSLFNHFKETERDQRDAYIALIERTSAEAEPFRDFGEGFEGVGAVLSAALLYFVEKFPAEAVGLFTQQEAEEVLATLQINDDIRAKKRTGEIQDLRALTLRQMRRVFVEYRKAHPDKIPTYMKDNLDRFMSYVPEDLREGGKKGFLKKVADTSRDVLNGLLRFGYGGTVLAIVAFVLSLVICPAWSSTLVFILFISYLLSTVAAVVIGRGWEETGENDGKKVRPTYLGLSLPSKVMVVIATLFLASIAFSLMFAVSATFTEPVNVLVGSDEIAVTSSPMFWAAYLLALANFLVWDVLAIRGLDDIFEGIRTAKTGVLATIKDIIPFGENAGDVHARAEARDKVGIFKYVVFQVGAILTIVWVPVGLAAVTGLESFYLRLSLVLFVVVGILGAAYVRSLTHHLSLRAEHEPGLRKIVEKEWHDNWILAFRALKYGGIVPIVSVLVWMAFDPMNLQDKNLDFGKIDHPTITQRVRHWRETAFVASAAEVAVDEVKVCTDLRDAEVAKQPDYCSGVMADIYPCVCTNASSETVVRVERKTTSSGFGKWLKLGFLALIVGGFGYWLYGRMSGGGHHAPGDEKKDGDKKHH
jgi:hypothetical protein